MINGDKFSKGFNLIFWCVIVNSIINFKVWYLVVNGSNYIGKVIVYN